MGVLDTPTILNVTFLPCPFGFELWGDPPKCDCAAHVCSPSRSQTEDCHSHIPDVHVVRQTQIMRNSNESHQLPKHLL